MEKKKAVKKVVKKVTPVVKEPEETRTVRSKSEGFEYWAERPVDDERMDWRNGAGTWIDEYVASKDHPHRQLILNALQGFGEFAGVLELGCNAGPNLLRISELYPETQLAGIDINKDAIARAQELLPKAVLKVGTVTELPFPDQSFDIVIADAVLMYTNEKEVQRVLDEVNRVARKGVILVEWYAQKSEITDYHWAHNYPEYLYGRGFTDVHVQPLTADHWPTQKWQDHGQLFIFHRA